MNGTEIIIAPLQRQDEPIAVSPEFLKERDELIAKSKATIKAVATLEDQTAATANGCAIARHLKAIEESRVEHKAPHLKINKMIDAKAREMSFPLEQESERLDKLISAFQVQEQKRVERENAAREAELKRLADEQAKAERMAREAAELAAKAAAAAVAAAEQPGASATQASAAADLEDQSHNLAMMAELQLSEKNAAIAALRAQPEAAPQRSIGQVSRKPIRWKITDKAKVFARFPHFFDLVEKRAIINATVSKDFKCDGMDVWEDNETSFRSS